MHQKPRCRHRTFGATPAENETPFERLISTSSGFLENPMSCGKDFGAGIVRVVHLQLDRSGRSGRPTEAARGAFSRASSIPVGFAGRAEIHLAKRTPCTIRAAAPTRRSFDLSACPGFYDDPPVHHCAAHVHPGCVRRGYFLTRYRFLQAVYPHQDLAPKSSRYGEDARFLLYEHHTTILVFNDPPCTPRPAPPRFARPSRRSNPAIAWSTPCSTHCRQKRCHLIELRLDDPDRSDRQHLGVPRERAPYRLVEPQF